MITPRSLSRREVLHTAGLLGIGAAVAPSHAEAAVRLPFAENSGLVTKAPKPLKYDEIPGLLTKAQVTPHYQAHYGGALKRFVTIEQQLEAQWRGKEPLGGDAFTLLQKDRVNRMNSVLLHELYFDGLTAKPGDPREDIRSALARR